MRGTLRRTAGCLFVQPSGQRAQRDGTGARGSRQIPAPSEPRTDGVGILLDDPRTSQSSAGRRQRRMLTARATMSAPTASDTEACSIIASFDQRDSGIVSVGLNAVALVKATYR